jgi:shikimate kinase
MGSGKTSVGERLARRLSYQFKDTDLLIEKMAGDTISHIFQTQGEEYFRSLETNLLKELKSTLHNCVLSTGGGLPIREQNAALLKDLGFVVYLKASKETTISRLQGDTTRPLLRDGDLNEKVERLLALRTPLYEKAAHITVVTDGRSFEDIMNNIMEAYLRLIR